MNDIYYSCAEATEKIIMVIAVAIVIITIIIAIITTTIRAPAFSAENEAPRRVETEGWGNFVSPGSICIKSSYPTPPKIMK